MEKNVTLYQASFNPSDPNIVVVVGKGFFKFYKLTDNQLKHTGQQVKNKEENISNDYTVHTWIEKENKIVLCNAQGDIQIYDSNGEYKCTVLTSPQRQLLISCVLPCSKGFIISESNTMISVYFRAEKNKDQKNPYKLRESFKLSTGYSLVWMTRDPVNDKAIDEPNEDKIIFSLSNGQLLSATINYDNIAATKIDPVICEFHTAKITGLDMCLMRPFVVTSSIDKTIKIWNYNTNALELSFPFVEEVQSVSIHPSGYHLIAAFSTTVRLMNIFSDKLKQYKELPFKKCNEVKFAHGGHLFALVDADAVIVFDFYNLIQINKVTGLASAISCMNWFEDDSGFVFCSINGRVAVCPYNGDKTIIDQDTNSNFTCSLKIDGKPDMFASGQFEFVKKYTPEESKKKQDNDEKEHKEEKKSGLLRAVSMNTKSHISQLAVASVGNTSNPTNSHILIAGTSDSNKPGSLRAYKYPLTGFFIETQAHSTQVSRIKVSPNEKMVFSAGNDGTLAQFRVVMKGEENKNVDSLHFPFKEILTNKQELEDKLKEIQQLAQSEAEIKEANKRQSEALEAAKNKELEELRRRKNEAIGSGNSDIEELTKKREEIISNCKETLTKMEEEHQKKIVREKEEHIKKMEDENKELKKLKETMEKKKEDFDKKKQAFDEDFKKSLNQLEKEHYQKIEEYKKKLEELEKQQLESEQKYEEKRKSIEESKDKTMEKKIIDNIQETQKINNEGLLRKQELMEYKKTETNDSKEISTKNQEIRKKDQELKGIEEQNISLKKLIKNLEIEIEERKGTLEEKKKRVAELNRKKQELNKFSFVLDYKIKELRRDINPKEQEIQKLKEQAANMDQELKQFKRVNCNLCLIVEDMQLRQKGMRREIKLQKEKLDQLNSYLSKFQEEISECANKTGNYRALKESIIELHKKFVLEEVKANTIDTDVQKEYSLHRKHLENKVQSFNNKIAKDQEDHKKENIKLMKENVELIEQINELRKALIFKYRKQKQDVDCPKPKDAKGKAKQIKLDEDRLAELSDEITNINAQIELAKKHVKLPPIERPKSGQERLEEEEIKHELDQLSQKDDEEEEEEEEEIVTENPQQIASGGEPNAKQAEEQKKASSPKEELMQKDAHEISSEAKSPS